MYRNKLQQVFRAAHFPVDRYGPPHLKITPKIIGDLRELSYIEQWKAALQNEWFHVKLEDHSLFIFNATIDNPSYSFLHAPVATESFRTYLNRQDLEYSARNKSAFSEEYAMLLETAAFRQHLTPIRFDVDKTGYRAGVHPMAHIHIGLENNVRLAVRREMTPLSFVLFVMRQMYPDSWARLLGRPEQFRLQQAIRDKLQFVSEEYWKEADNLELHLY